MFGFFNMKTGHFYEMKQIKPCVIYIEGCALFNVLDKGSQIKYSYDITNFPPLINIIKSEEFPNRSHIAIQFSHFPTVTQDTKLIVCENHSSNLNEFNNLLNIDSIYKYMVISQVENEKVGHFQRGIGLCSTFFQNFEHLSLKMLDKLSFINDLKKGISNSPLIYSKLSQISQLVSTNHNYNIFEIIAKDTQVASEEAVERDGFLRIKCVQISPLHIIFNSPHWHQSSRFLRRHFENDNLIKLEFIEAKGSKLITSNEMSSNLSQLYNLIFEKGIVVCNKKYEFFIFTTTNLRNNSVWMIETAYLNNKGITKESLYTELGLENLEMAGMSLSKTIARLSQNFTATWLFKNFEKIETKTIEDIMSSDCNFCFSDGCGKISQIYMNEVCQRLNSGREASAIQIRYKGVKGVLLVDSNIQTKCMEFTKSMVKFECNNCEDLEIIRFSDFSQGYLNLQIVILLLLNGVKSSSIIKCAKRNLQELSEIQKKDFLKVLKHRKSLLNHYQINSDYLSESGRLCYIYNQLSNMSRKFRIKVKKSGCFIGVVDFYGILNEDEIFIQVSENNRKKVILGDAVITKNPCLSLYDLQKVKCVEASPYFQSHYFNVVVFPQKGNIPLPQKISNSDLDGDVYFVCWDSNLTRIKKTDYNNKPEYLIKDINTLKYKEENFDKTGITFDQKLQNYMIYYNQNNKISLINSRYLTNSNLILRNKKDFNISLVNENEKLALCHNIEVDFPKTGITPVLNGSSKGSLPDYLKKENHQRKIDYMNLLNQTYLNYRKHSVSISFWDYLNSVVQGKKKQKYMKLYEYHKYV